ncbi:MAG TPA: protein translocase subunit SecD [Gemmatimonadaceae bacterium]|jgi:preprotein translocase subunit SecD|nr:protein translocase subunit SecD [Gemmatimonadaceae bacterium]
MPLKYRILIIVGLCLASIYLLFPRDVTTRYRGADGVLRVDTSRHVPLRRGLDLQGGMYLALEVDDSKQAIAPADKKEAINRALKTVRSRIDGFGVSEPVVQTQGDDRIVVQLPGIQDRERAERLMQDQAFLQFKITDKTQALERALPKLDQVIKQRGLSRKVDTTSKGQAATKGLQGLLTQADTGLRGKLSPATPAKKGDTSKKVVAAKKDTAKSDTANADSLKLQAGGAFSSLLQQGDTPGGFFVASENVPTLDAYLADSVVHAALPPGKEFLPGTDSQNLGGKVYKAYYLVDAKPIITGDYLKDARPNQQALEGTVVEFTLSNEGGRRFRNETGKHIGDYMAIILDDRVQGRPPVIQSAISTRGQITMGGKSLADAQDLALVLRAGALPVPLRVAEVRSIGPSLGQDSINKGLRASLIAVALVVIIMLVYYRFSGFLAVAALALYVLYTLAALAGFDAVLTLPGIAGFVLSIGIAVDANVLIFERIREELARGKTVRTAIDEGFRHAMPAIVDSNVSTILTAAVLYQYGTGPVKGFAVTLIAGIAASLFTSIFVVRTFYIIWLNRSRGAQALSI